GLGLMHRAVCDLTLSSMHHAATPTPDALSLLDALPIFAAGAREGVPRESPGLIVDARRPRERGAAVDPRHHALVVGGRRRSALATRGEHLHERLRRRSEERRVGKERRVWGWQHDAC